MQILLLRQRQRGKNAIKEISNYKDNDPIEKRFLLIMIRFFTCSQQSIYEASYLPDC
jgi:hypothetical protein